MSDRALSRTPSPPAAHLAKLNKPGSRAPSVVGVLVPYPLGLGDVATGLTWPGRHRFSGTPS